MKVIWFSNCSLCGCMSSGSGSWLHAMKQILIGHVNIINITDGDVKDVHYSKEDKFEEYILPEYKLKNGIPSEDKIGVIQNIISTVKPDIIHIWGLEKYWGLLYARGFIKGTVIVEIQGLLSGCASACYAGLEESEIKQTYRIKELIKPNSSMRNLYQYYIRASRFESEILRASKFLSTQSEWVRDMIKFTPLQGFVYETVVPIREEFLRTTSWKESDNGTIKIFTSISYLLPFKGLHILLKAISVLKKKYPEIQLYIAGNCQVNVPFYRKSGYAKMLTKYIKDYDLKKNIVFLGSLNAYQIVEQLSSCNVYVNSSFIESYSTSAAEALCMGVPSVMAFAGALPDFSREEPVCLYYSPMDYHQLAAKVDRVLTDVSLRKVLSQRAIKNIKFKCEFDYIRNKQIEIYNDVIKRSS